MEGKRGGSAGKSTPSLWPEVNPWNTHTHIIVIINKKIKSPDFVELVNLKAV